MSFEPGGRADKLGNRYEGRWVADRLLALLNEQLRSVTVEAVGDDEQGVDIWLTLNDGSHQACQCKARNRATEKWTVADLAARGVLGHLKAQLDRSPDTQFVFVSAIPGQMLGDMCDSARNSSGNPEDFFVYQVQNAGHARQSAFAEFCARLDLSAERETDRATAFNYLRRTFVTLYPDDRDCWRRLLATAGFLLTGEPESSVALLAAFAENHDYLGKTIHVDDLRKFLATQHIHPKDLSHDGRVAPVVERLRREFDATIEPLLIRNTVIHRDETDKCRAAIGRGKSIILHGAAGSGKSGVLHELTLGLLRDNIPFLPVRLDRRVPRDNAASFGRDMGLPDSPAYCLRSLAADRMCVLILDQLDSVRWTVSHSSTALAVCREMVRQAKTPQSTGTRCCIVMSCRTFDMEHDPEIRAWLEGHKNDEWEKIETGPLPEPVVQAHVGSDFNSLTKQQRLILSNPQRLHMWVVLQTSASHSTFRSATELTRQFLAHCRGAIEKEGVPAQGIVDVFDCLVDWANRHGRFSVPKRTIERCSATAIAAMKSYGIIQEQNNLISFSHQSYLDFLVADGAVRKLDGGSSIIEWLGPKENQTLFRREQLRHVLALLSEDSPDRFLAVARDILSANVVRFHLKHLVLETIGLTDISSPALTDYCVDLLGDAFWRNHVLHALCRGNTHLVAELADRGEIRRMLDSGDENSVASGLDLIRSIADRQPDLVVRELRAYTNKSDEWSRKVLGAMCWEPDDDSDSMFDLRMQLAGQGVVSDMHSWKALCERHPLRALRFVGVLLSTRTPDTINQPVGNPDTGADRWSIDALSALSKASEREPLETLDLILPHIERLTVFDASRFDDRLLSWRRDPVPTGYMGIARGSVELVMHAGQTLANSNAQALLQRMLPREDSPSVVIQEVIAECYATLPSDCADKGIAWLLSDTRRFSLGNPLSEPEWMPAVRLVRSLSPHCSDELFARLEQTLIHLPYPLNKATTPSSPQVMHYRNHKKHLAQHWLLSALCQERKSPPAVALGGVLGRSLGDHVKDIPVRGKVSGGWINSKLDKNLDAISDRAWLEIVGNHDIPEEGLLGRWQQVDRDHAVTSSVELFASSIGKMAKRFPERFGKLALRFPPDVHHAYVAAVLGGVSLVKPDTEASKEDATPWTPATIETAMAVCAQFMSIDTREGAQAFCRLVSARACESMALPVITRLMDLAQHHPDLEQGKLNVDCDKRPENASVWQLFQNTINCVRGVAAEAIGELLWYHPELFDHLRPALRSLVTDSHPVVRMASVRALTPMLRLNATTAVVWFCEACQGDPRVGASPYAVDFMNRAIPGHRDSMRDVIDALLQSHLPDVSLQGARAATAYHLFHGGFGKQVDICRKGTAPQRQGVAEIAASHLHVPRYASMCRDLVSAYFDDPDKDVREATASMFQDDFLESDENRSLARSYVQSKAFTDGHFWFLRCVGNHKGSLIPIADIILDLCKVAAADPAAAPTGIAVRSLPFGVIREASTLLLRLYEQAQEGDPVLACRCLDLWDIMFERRIGQARELTAAMEK